MPRSTGGSAATTAAPTAPGGRWPGSSPPPLVAEARRALDRVRVHCDRGPVDALSVRRDGDVATITLTRPERRNVLALEVLEALTEAFGDVGRSDARGVVLAAEGPV